MGYSVREVAKDLVNFGCRVECGNGNEPVCRELLFSSLTVSRLLEI